MTDDKAKANGTPKGKRLCSELTKSGEPCKTTAMKDRDVCCIHDPATAHRGRVAGGLASARAMARVTIDEDEAEVVIRFRSLDGIVVALEFVAQGVATGGLDEKAGNAITQAANTAIRAHSVKSEIAERERKVVGELSEEELQAALKAWRERERDDELAEMQMKPNDRTDGRPAA